MGLALALTAAFAQQGIPALGKPGEPFHLVVGYQPYFTASWSAIIASDLGFWKQTLPAGSTVRLEFTVNGPVVADGMKAGRMHVGYLGDVPAVALAAAGEPDVRLVAVAALSQDQCLIVVRRDAPEFAAPAEAARWLAGKRIAMIPGTCHDRSVLAVFASIDAQPPQTINLSREMLSAAFAEQLIDAASTNEPVASELIESGQARRAYSAAMLGKWDAALIAVPAALLALAPR